jgi:hypothetical protein
MLFRRLFRLSVLMLLRKRAERREKDDHQTE